jgi:ParB-like chromosome segregation protein Spo0J
MSHAIVAALLPLAVPVDNLTLDPDNARRGDVEAVRRSLNTFGQRKPIVVKRTGTDADNRPAGIVTAGNHTLMAALDLGWTEIAAVFTDDDATTARAYALADNRTGELAGWDDAALAASLAELNAESFDMASLGWSDTDLAALLNGGTPTAGNDDDRPAAADEPTRCPQCGYEWDG